MAGIVVPVAPRGSLTGGEGPLGTEGRKPGAEGLSASRDCPQKSELGFL